MDGGALDGQRATPLKDHVAAISCGISQGSRCSTSTMSRIQRADTDANFVMTGTGGLVEVQGTAEGKPFSEDEFMAMLRLARRASPGSSSCRSSR